MQVLLNEEEYTQVLALSTLVERLEKELKDSKEVVTSLFKKNTELEAKYNSLLIHNVTTLNEQSKRTLRT